VPKQWKQIAQLHCMELLYAADEIRAGKLLFNADFNLEVKSSKGGMMPRHEAVY